MAAAGNLHFWLGKQLSLAEHEMDMIVRLSLVVVQSKNKLSHKAEMNWKQIDNYCTNSITRLDVFVLCKLCTVLECGIEDLLVFYPPEKQVLYGIHQ